MKDTDKRIKVCFCCQKIQNFQASLHCFMQNLNIYNFMNFSSQNNHTEMIFICIERSCCPLSKMVKQNLVRHLVSEILIDLSVAFFFTQSLFVMRRMKWQHLISQLLVKLSFPISCLLLHSIYWVRQNACPSRDIRPMHKTKMLPKMLPDMS